VLISSANAQIDTATATVQTIAYWDLNETHSFTVSQKKSRINGADTTVLENMRYGVDVTVVDSTANSYTVDWAYRDYQYQSDNQLFMRISDLYRDMTVRFETDEMGSFQRVQNWTELRDVIHHASQTIKEEAKSIPGFDAVIDKLMAVYSSQEMVEQSAIPDIQMFLSFHGASYTMGDIYQQRIEVPNLVTGGTLPADMAVTLDDILVDDNAYVLRLEQVVDEVQLRAFTVQYLKEMGRTMELPEFSDDQIPPVRNEVGLVAVIHGSGWPLYTQQTKSVSAQGIEKLEVMTIEMD